MSAPSPLPLESLDARARKLVAAVRDDPEGRYRLRAEFYRRYGGEAPGEFGYGNSEMAFLRWEIDRGTLNPPGHQRPGSPWWRAVNEEFIYTAELAGLISESGGEPGAIPRPVRCWLDYLRQPGSKAWYRAHNASIVWAYIQHAAVARDESAAERAFVNVVLYRVLYAESLEEGAGIGLGRWSRLLALPALPAVQVLVHLPRLYPTNYPIQAAEGRRMRKLVSPRIVEASEREFGEAELNLPVLRPVDHALRRLSRLAEFRGAAAFLLHYVTARWMKEIIFLGRAFEDLAQFVMDRILITPHLTELYNLAATEWLQEPTLLDLLDKGIPSYPRKARENSKARADATN